MLADRGAAGVRLVVRGVGVGHQGDRVAERGGAAHGGIHTEFTGVAADGDAVNATSLKQRLQLGAQERIRCGLAHEKIAVLVLQTSGQPPAIVSVLECGAVALMLDPDHRYVGAARGTRQGVDAVDHGVGLERPGCPVEQAALNINDQQGGFHGQVPGTWLNRAAQWASVTPSASISPPWV